MKTMKYLAAGFTTLMLDAAGMFLSPTARAGTLPSPDNVFQDWNNSFLVQGGSSGTYYTDELKSIGTARAGTWIAALDILVARDVYERTHAPADRQRVSDLVTTFLAHASPFSGNYQIKNVASNMSLGGQADSTANSAAIVQNADTGDASASWTFVPESNGYYEIKNSRSGELLNVSAASGAPGALIVQWPAGGLQPGNDQWMPVRNSDGTYSFYNRSSQLALDDPGGSTAAGTQFEQWPQNDTTGQKFNLTSRTTGTGPTGSSGAVKSGIAGKCLDLNGGNTTNGTQVQLWSCNGGGAPKSRTTSGLSKPTLSTS